jgi:hypothetical protein
MCGWMPAGFNIGIRPSWETAMDVSRTAARLFRND